LLSGIFLALLCLVIVVLAMAESALTFASRAKLEDALQSAGARARYLRYLERAAAARPLCVVGRVAAVVGLAAILAGQPAGRLAAATAWLAMGAVVAAMELGGRYVGKRWGTVVLIALLPALQGAWLLAAPLRLARRRRSARAPAEPDEQVVDAAMEEIRVAIEDAASEGAIKADEKQMIEGVLEFEDVEVHEIMTPRTEMECIEVGTALKDSVETIAGFHHSRIPVYEGVQDKVVGIVHLKDLLPLVVRPDAADRSLREVMREPLFVPETKRAVSLLRDFKQRRVQIAIILDEYGGVTGLVTLEDVMEQIVGELEEGSEAEGGEERIRKLGPGTLDVDARLNVSEVNDLLGVDLPEDEDYDTVGGFMMARFARVPEKGRELRHNGVLLRVLDSDERRVRRVLLQRIEPEQPEDSR